MTDGEVSNYDKKVEQKERQEEPREREGETDD